MTETKTKMKVIAPWGAAIAFVALLAVVGAVLAAGSVFGVTNTISVSSYPPVGAGSSTPEGGYPTPQPGDRDDSNFASADSEGRFVAFTSLASNLVYGTVDGDSNRYDVFLHNRRVEGVYYDVPGNITTENLTQTSDSDTGQSTMGVVSPDGSMVVYQSSSSEIALADAPMALGNTGIETNYSYFGTLQYQRVAFPFSPTSANWKNLYLQLYIASVNSPTDNVEVNLYTDASGLPNEAGGSLGTAQLPASALWAGYSWKSLRMDLASALTQGQTYWFVISRSGALDDDHYYLVGTNDNAAAGANVWMRDGSVWGNPNPTRYLIFAIRYATAYNGKSNLYLWRSGYASGTAELISLPTGSNLSDMPQGNGDSGSTSSTYIPSDPAVGMIDRDYTRPAASIYLDGVHPNVLFESVATNLVAGDTNNARDLFIRDVDEHTTSLLVRACVSPCTPGSETYSGFPNDASYHPVVSSDGRYVAFVSRATNLVATLDYTNSPTNIFLMDRDHDTDGTLDEYSQAGAVQIILISKQVGGNPGVGQFQYTTSGPYWSSRYPTISDDGSYVAFQSYSNVLGSDSDTNGVTDIFLYSRADGTVNRISKSSEGVQGNRASYTPFISGDGNLVAFTSYSDNLVVDDTNVVSSDRCRYSPEGTTEGNCPDIFIYYVPSPHEVWRASLTQEGVQAFSSSGYPVMSQYGQYVFFTSYGSMTTDGTDTSIQEVYVRDQGVPPGNPNLQPSSWTLQPAQIAAGGTNLHKIFTIKAIGTLRVISVNLETLGRNDFTIYEDTCTGQSLVANTTCTIEVQYLLPLEQLSKNKLQIHIDFDMEGEYTEDRILEASLTGINYHYVYYPLIDR